MGHKPEMTPQKAAAYKRLAGMLDKICDEAVAAEMSDHQAETKAKELWGVNGAAWHNGCARKDDLRYCQVGLRVGDVQDSWKVFGRGKSWQRAFDDARQRGYCE